MSHCALIVFSNPVAGREDEYDDWYSHRHLGDVLPLPGFRSAQRFKLAQNEPAAPWKCLAIYEFEADDPARSQEEEHAPVILEGRAAERPVRPDRRTSLKRGISYLHAYSRVRGSLPIEQ